MNVLTAIVLFAVLVLLLVLSAFFSGCETALFSLTPIQQQRLRDRAPDAGRRIQTLLADPALTLSTLLIGNTLVNFGVAWVGYRFIDMLLPSHSELIAIPLITVLLLFFGEVTPKRLALHHAERLAPRLLPVMNFFIALLTPLSRLLQSTTRVVKHMLRPERKAISGDELLTLIEVGEEQGQLDAEERSMVDGIIRLSELKASDVMTPRVDLVGVDLDTPPAQQDAVLRATRFRYVPAYLRTPDAIEGFIDTIRYLLSPEQDVRKAVVPALFVPENVSLDDLLVTFQRSGKHIACVLDEYGGTAGIVTRGDILELVVAPVAAHGEPEDAPEIVSIGESTWLIDGRASLEAVNHTLDISLDADDADRIAGWVTLHAGRIPHPGFQFESQGCRCTVRRLRHRSVDLVQIEVLDAALEGDLDDGEEDDQS